MNPRIPSVPRRWSRLLLAAFAFAVAELRAAEDAALDPVVEETEEPGALDVYSEWLRDRVGQTLDEVAGWLDRRFGDLHPRYREKTYGHIRLVPLWVQYHGWEVDTRFRARVDLPNIDKRLHAVFGAGDRDSFETGRPVLAELEEMALIKERFGHRDVLAGLGYSLSETSNSSLRLSSGVRLRFPIEPHTRLRYARLVPLGNDTLWRFHQTLYARTQQGLGSVTGMDVEHILTPKLLGRAMVFAHFSTRDELPVEYGSEVSLARALPRHRVLALTAFYLVHPKAEVPVRDYGLRSVYRWRLSGDHLFGELHTGVAWPRTTVEEKRRASLNLGAGVELRFGPRSRR